MRTLILLVSILGIGIASCGTAPDDTDTITIRGPDGATYAQMFDEAGNIIARIPNGTECTILGSYTLTEAGVEIPLYELDCSGQVGYVNRQWTR